MLGEPTIGAWFVDLFTGTNVILIHLLSIQEEYQLKTILDIYEIGHS